MDHSRAISQGLRTGDFLWSLPLAKALGPQGRLLSVLWVERSLHRMVDLAGFRLDDGCIHDKIAAARTALAIASDEKELAGAVERAGLRGDPLMDAIGLLYWAYWRTSHRDDNEFALTQESVFRRLATFWDSVESVAVATLVVEEFERMSAEATSSGGPSDVPESFPE